MSIVSRHSVSGTIDWKGEEVEYSATIGGERDDGNCIDDCSYLNNWEADDWEECEIACMEDAYRQLKEAGTC